MADVSGTDLLVRHEKENVANGYDNNGFHSCEKKGDEEKSASDDDRLRIVVTQNGRRTEGDIPLPNGHAHDEPSCQTTSLNGTAVVVLGAEDNGSSTLDHGESSNDSTQKPLDNRLHHFVPVEDRDRKILNGSDSTHVSIPEDAVISFSTGGRVRVKNRASNSPQSERERESIPLESIPTSYDVEEKGGLYLEKKAEVEAELSSNKNGVWSETNIYSGSEAIFNSEKLNGTSKSSDEVSLPVNSHRKCLRGEKLYFTEDNRKLCPGWRRLILCALILIIVAIAVCLAVLAATGILLAESDSKNIRHESGHSLPSVDSISQAGFPLRRPSPNVPQKFQPSVTTEVEYLPNTTSKASTNGVQVTVSPASPTVSSKVPVLNDASHSQTIVPNALVGEFTIIDENFTDDLNDNSSQGYRNLANNLEIELRRIFRENRGQFEKLQILNFRPGSIRVKFVVIWIPNHQTISASRASEILSSDLGRRNNSFFNLFHVDISTIQFIDVFDECKIQNGGCNFGCSWNYDTLVKTCICPENTYLQADEKSCGEKTETSTRIVTVEPTKPTISSTEQDILTTTPSASTKVDKQPFSSSVSSLQPITENPLFIETTTRESDTEAFSVQITTTENPLSVSKQGGHQEFTTEKYETTTAGMIKELTEKVTLAENNKQTSMKHFIPTTTATIPTTGNLEDPNTHVSMTIYDASGLATTTVIPDRTKVVKPLTETYLEHEADATTESEPTHHSAFEENTHDTTFGFKITETEAHTHKQQFDATEKATPSHTNSPTYKDVTEGKTTLKYRIIETPTEIYTVKPYFDYTTEFTKSSTLPGIVTEQSYTTSPPEPKLIVTKTPDITVTSTNTDLTTLQDDLITGTEKFWKQKIDLTTLQTQTNYAINNFTEETNLTAQENTTLPITEFDHFSVTELDNFTTQSPDKNVTFEESVTTTLSSEVNTTLKQPLVTPHFNRTPGVRSYDNFTDFEEHRPMLTTIGYTEFEANANNNTTTEISHTNNFPEFLTTTNGDVLNISSSDSYSNESIYLPTTINYSNVSLVTTVNDTISTVTDMLKENDTQTTSHNVLHFETTTYSENNTFPVTASPQITTIWPTDEFNLTMESIAAFDDFSNITTPSLFRNKPQAKENSTTLQADSTKSLTEFTTIMDKKGAETTPSVLESPTTMGFIIDTVTKEINTFVTIPTFSTEVTETPTYTMYSETGETMPPTITLHEKHADITTISNMPTLTTKETFATTTELPKTKIVSNTEEGITTVTSYKKITNPELAEPIEIHNNTTTASYLENKTETLTTDELESETETQTYQPLEFKTQRNNGENYTITDEAITNNFTSNAENSTTTFALTEEDLETVNASSVTKPDQVTAGTETINTTQIFKSVNISEAEDTTIPFEIYTPASIEINGNQTEFITTTIEPINYKTNTSETIISLDNETSATAIHNDTRTMSEMTNTFENMETTTEITTTNTESISTQFTRMETNGTTRVYEEGGVILPTLNMFDNETLISTDNTSTTPIPTVDYSTITETLPDLMTVGTLDHNTTFVADETISELNKTDENSTLDFISSTSNFSIIDGNSTFNYEKENFTTNGYDESTNETTTNASVGIECRTDQFICEPLNVCLNNTFMCDGILDCPDGTDEFDCQDSCHTNFMCINSSTCIMNEARCDGIWDCENGTDEEFCTPTECAKHEVMCSDGSKCIKPVDICDWKYDCKDRSDEVGCVERTTCESNGKFFCNDGLCIPWSLKCDGEFDCKDKEDEGNCTCLNDEFQCNDGKCLKSSSRCDGHRDCHDGDDEMGCVNVDSQHMVVTFEPYSGTWALLCAEDFNLDDGHYLCQELGYGHALKVDKLHVSFNGTWMAMRRDNLTDASLWTERVSFVESCTTSLAASVECQKFACGEYTGLLHRRKRDILSSSTSSQWPFIGYTSTFHSNRGCLSEILTPIWLITSAECLLSISKEPYNGSDWYVRTNIGQKTETDLAQNHEVLRITSHSHSSKFRSLILRDYDVALVRLKHALVFVSDKIGAICPPEEQVPPGITCFSGVLGTEKPRAPPPPILSINSLALQILDRKNCNTVDHYNNSINQRMLCTQSSEGHTICDNDEGTPLMCLTGINKWFLAGMLTYQRYCEVYSKHPAVFSNLYSMRKFIDQVTGQKQYEIPYDSNVYVIIPPTTPSPTVPETTTAIYTTTEFLSTIEFTETTLWNYTIEDTTPITNYSSEFTTDIPDTLMPNITDTTIENINMTTAVIENLNMTTAVVEEMRSDNVTTQANFEFESNYTTISHLGHGSTLTLLDMENSTTLPPYLLDEGEMITTINTNENNTLNDFMFDNITETENLKNFTHNFKFAITPQPFYSETGMTEMSVNKTENHKADNLTETSFSNITSEILPVSFAESVAGEHTASFITTPSAKIVESPVEFNDTVMNKLNYTTYSSNQSDYLTTVSNFNFTNTTPLSLDNTETPYLGESNTTDMITTEGMETESFIIEMDGEPDTDLVFDVFTSKEGIRLESPMHIENLESTPKFKEHLSRSRNLDEPHNISDILYDVTTKPTTKFTLANNSFSQLTSPVTEASHNTTETLKTNFDREIQTNTNTTRIQPNNEHLRFDSANEKEVTSLRTLNFTHFEDYTATTISPDLNLTRVTNFTEYRKSINESETIKPADSELSEPVNVTKLEEKTTNFTNKSLTKTTVEETTPVTLTMVEKTMSVTVPTFGETTLIPAYMIKENQNPTKIPAKLSEFKNLESTTEIPTQTENNTVTTIISKFQEASTATPMGRNNTEYKELIAKFESLTKNSTGREDIIEIETTTNITEPTTTVDYVTITKRVKEYYEKKPEFAKLTGDTGVTPITRENLSEIETTTIAPDNKQLSVLSPRKISEERELTTKLPPTISEKNDSYTNLPVATTNSEATETLIHRETDNTFQTQPVTTVPEKDNFTILKNKTEETIVNQTVHNTQIHTATTETTYPFHVTEMSRTDINNTETGRHFKNVYLPAITTSNESLMMTLTTETPTTALHDFSENGTMSETTMTTPYPEPIEHDTNISMINNSSMVVHLSSEKLIVSGKNNRTDKCGLWNNVSNQTDLEKMKFYEEWPALGYLQMITEPKMCAATILSSHLVITSLNCISFRDHQLNPGNWAFISGIYNSSTASGLQTHLVAEIIPHAYAENTLLFHKHNLALVRLKDDIEMTEFSQNACLPDNEKMQQCFTTGWSKPLGVEQEKKFYSVPVNIIPQNECNSTANYNGLLLDTLICASRENTSSLTCQMDLGSPLYCSYKNRWSLHGVLNFPGPCDMDQPAVYNSISSIEDWITKFLIDDTS